MSAEERAAHYRTAYDLLRGIFFLTTGILVGVIFILCFIAYDAKKSIDLNTQRYDEMRQAAEVQAVYFNNMKARIEAMNREKE